MIQIKKREQREEKKEKKEETKMNTTMRTWELSKTFWATSLSFLSIEIVLTAFTNILLILTICYSPNLKTPANAYLINICGTNLALMASMLLSLITLVRKEISNESILSRLQIFLRNACFLQYWALFAAIGYYRSKILCKPLVNIRSRRKIIKLTTAGSWFLSILLSSITTAMYSTTTNSLCWNAFRSEITYNNSFSLEDLKALNIVGVFLFTSTFFIFFLIILTSFIRIFNPYCTSLKSGRNRIAPWIIDDSDVVKKGKKTYRPFPTTDSDSTIVHYQKKSHSASIDEVFAALENPIRAQIKLGYNIHHKNLHRTVSGTSNGSETSKCPEFSDITPAAQFSKFNWLRNIHSTAKVNRKEKLSLSSATKNSLIMVVTFIILSFPLFIASFPGIFKQNAQLSTFHYILLSFNIVFYFNAPAYPIWYLIFSRRVRNCLQKLYDSLLAKMNFRR